MEMGRQLKMHDDDNDDEKHWWPSNNLLGILSRANRVAFRTDAWRMWPAYSKMNEFDI